MISRIKKLSWVLFCVVIMLSLMGSGFYLDPSPAAQTLGIAMGVHLRPIDRYTLGIGGELVNFNAAMGKDAAILMYFLPWNGANAVDQVLDEYNLWSIEDKFPNAADRPVIMLTWSPVILDSQYKDPELGECNSNLVNGGTIPLQNMIDGKCDNFIRIFARDLADRPERILIRTMHEMNITDQNWHPANQGLTPADYIAAWRHIHDVFTAEQDRIGIHNGEWVWSPNYGSYPYEEWNAYYNYYPGDDYVDWIGLSGYSWNDEYRYRFQEIYGDVDGTDANLPPGVLQDMACRYDKPQIIAEIGVASSVDYKNYWLSDAFSMIPQYPFLRAVVWFNDYAFANTGGTDFRVYDADQNIDSATTAVDSSITAQYKSSISSSLFVSDLPSVEAATPPRVYCGGGAAEYSVSSAIMLMPGGTGAVSLSGMNVPDGQSITVNASSPLNVSNVPTELTSPWGEDSFDVHVSPSAALGSYPFTVVIGSKTYTVTVIVVDQINSNFLPSALSN